ncbi:hypothetical protein BJ742DRAFT_767252 [Cladochytrium replicatum]|nr:hypothetical protein BJ742DRAFT_767252 [Cladochytrium replicatum]
MREESERHRTYTSTTFVVGTMRAAAGIAYLDHYVSDKIIESRLSRGLLVGYSIGLSVIALVFSFRGSLFLIDTIGRRRMALYSTMVLVLPYAAVGGTTSFAKTSSATAIATLVMYICYAADSALWSPLQDVYAIEIWPFALRAKAISANSLLFATSAYLYASCSALGVHNLKAKFLLAIRSLCAVGSPWSGSLCRDERSHSRRSR